MSRHVLAVVLSLAVLTGCAPTLAGVRVYYPDNGPVPSGDHVTMHYLGNGGWLIRHDGHVVATAPFVTNPLNAAVYLPAESDQARLSTLPPMRDVKSILIGHAHYDHAMDLPYIMRELAPEATLYGGNAVTRLFRRTLGANRVVDVSEKAYLRDQRAGEWIDLPHAPIRILPLSSSHAPHLFGFVKVVSWRKRLEKDVEPGELPTVPAAWPEGDTLAYLVDFLAPDRSKVVFRVYYQDSATPPGIGSIPKSSDDVPVDVAILCVAAFNQVGDDNPQHILADLKPRYVVGGHWEDFFMGSRDRAPQVAPGTNIDEFVRRTHKAVNVPIYLPEPYKKIFIPIVR